ncbi:hypothetical protein [Bacillus cereus]|uniref:hypothetical protein n=1 Tax=Bacillus cereus TaxID=1396 RepID=UPI000B4BDEFF|nr:hypothetical protein [Bacillus cereus]
MGTHKPAQRPSVKIKNIEEVGPKTYEILMDVNDTYNGIQDEIFVTCTGGFVEGDSVIRTKSPFSTQCIQTIKFKAARGVEEYEHEQAEK